MSKITIAGMQRAKALADVRMQQGKGQRLQQESALVHTWIERKHLRAEPELQQMAWVQYRYMTPLERTELFTKAYHSAYVRMYAKHFPEGDASKKRPVDLEFVRNDIGVMNALWRARAQADLAGVPYEVYLETIIEAHLVNDRWKQPPRPNQLYGKLVQPRLQGLPTRAMVAERLYGLDWDVRFLANQYQGDGVQESAIHMMRDVVMNAKDPASSLGVYLCDKQVLPLDKALDVFGPTLVRDAIARSGRPPIERGRQESLQQVPGCFGFVSMDDDSSCQACPVLAECIAFSGRVRDDVLRATGSDDPRNEWRKAKNRERQQRHRDKAKRDELGHRIGGLIGLDAGRDLMANV